MGFAVRLDRCVSIRRRADLVWRPASAEGVQAAHDGLHRSIDSAVLFGLAFNGPHSDGEHGGDRKQGTSGKRSDYLASIGHH